MGSNVTPPGDLFDFPPSLLMWLGILRRSAIAIIFLVGTGHGMELFCEHGELRVQGHNQRFHLKGSSLASTYCSLIESLGVCTITDLFATCLRLYEGMALTKYLSLLTGFQLSIFIKCADCNVSKHSTSKGIWDPPPEFCQAQIHRCRILMGT